MMFSKLRGYGYRKTGEKQDACLVVSDDPITGLAMSEAEVIREVFRMAAVERKSCIAIADRLNTLRNLVLGTNLSNGDAPGAILFFDPRPPDFLSLMRRMCWKTRQSMLPKTGVPLACANERDVES